nr:GAF domain-containing protein [Chloroflexota bacterium]
MDRGKLGSKYHLVVDRSGIPLAVRLSAANVHDSKVLEPLVDAIPPIVGPRGRPGRPRFRPAKLHADKAYDSAEKRRALRARGITPRIARRGAESSARLGQYRWVVERTFSRLPRRLEARPRIRPGARAVPSRFSDLTDQGKRAIVTPTGREECRGMTAQLPDPSVGAPTDPRQRVADLEQENARLRRDRAEGTARESAMSEILRVIASSPSDLQSVLDTVAEQAARLCDPHDVVILRVDGDVIRPVAAYGGELRVTTPLDRRAVAGRAILDRETIHIHDMAAEPDDDFPISKAIAQEFGHRTILATPLLREDVGLGAILVRHVEVRPFTDEQIKLLKTFADQAVIAIENARLFEELERRTRELTEALEQQTATTEVLRAIASAPTSLGAVLGTLVASAARLTHADEANILRIEGSTLPVVASTSGHPAISANAVMPLDERSVSGRAIRERRAIVADEPREEHEAKYPASVMHKAGFQAEVVAPLLHRDAVLGTLIVFRRGRLPFDERDVALVTTFADQAVIAIENARLFGELEQRTVELGQALEQQTALSEILRVIATSPTDLSSVLSTIAERAASVLGAADAIIDLRDGDSYMIAGGWGPLYKAVGERWPITNGSIAGRVLLTADTVHIEDIAAVAEREFPDRAAEYLQAGGGTRLAVPLLREGMAIGVIVVRRSTVRLFSDEEIARLRAF